jgi:Uma2 family endonuclease
MKLPIQSDFITLSDFIRLPETKPAREYIDGKIVSKPMPKGKHSRLQTRLSAEINRVAEPDRIACAFTELRCTFGGRSLVPDISIFAWENLPIDESGEIENTFERAPDWTIEILSPEQSQTRVIGNILFCLNAGTQLGWLIDPEASAIVTFKPREQPEFRQGGDRLPVLSLLKDWQISVQDVFSCLNFR